MFEVKDCYFCLDGKMEKLNVSSIELEAVADDSDDKMINLLKEASFTTEVKMPMVMWYELFGMSGVPNNWLKQHGIPMRRRKGMKWKR